MNEQILKLYKQAQEFAYRNISKESWNTDNFHAVVSGMLAELIVRECLDIAKNWEDQLDNASCLKESNAVGIVAYRISRQFGVEE